MSRRCSRRCSGAPARAIFRKRPIERPRAGVDRMAGAAAEASESDSQFRIEATGAFREPRTRILKHGDTFAVLNHFGDIAGGRGSPARLYHHATRHLAPLGPYLHRA